MSNVSEFLRFNLEPESPVPENELWITLEESTVLRGIFSDLLRANDNSTIGLYRVSDPTHINSSRVEQHLSYGQRDALCVLLHRKMDDSSQESDEPADEQSLPEYVFYGRDTNVHRSRSDIQSRKVARRVLIGKENAAALSELFARLTATKIVDAVGAVAYNEYLLGKVGHFAASIREIAEEQVQHPASDMAAQVGALALSSDIEFAHVA